MLIRVMVKDASQKIALIKLVRTMTNWGLKEAKDFVEKYCVHNGDSFLVRVDDPTKAFRTLCDFMIWGEPEGVWANLIRIEVASETPVALTI